MDNELAKLLERENWRKMNWQRLGWNDFQATTLAIDDSVDWHDVENFLVAHPNCDHQTALEIVR